MAPFSPLQGVYTALVTPFSSNTIDYRSLRTLLEQQIDAGVQGLVLLDTTGEGSTIDATERKQLLSFVSQNVHQKLPIWVSIQANCTIRALHLMEEAEAFGIDGFLIVTPYYNRPTQSGLYLHFATLAKATQKPICLHSSPFRCGVELTTETIQRLRKTHPNLVALKESGGSCNRVAQLMKENDADFHVLAGEDAFALPFFALGAKGVISVAANWIPKEMVHLFQKVSENDFEGAANINRRYYPLFRALTLETNPVPIKYVLHQAGILSSPDVRLPLCPLSTSNAAALDHILCTLQKA